MPSNLQWKVIHKKKSRVHGISHKTETKSKDPSPPLVKESGEDSTTPQKSQFDAKHYWPVPNLQRVSVSRQNRERSYTPGCTSNRVNEYQISDLVICRHEQNWTASGVPSRLTWKMRSFPTGSMVCVLMDGISGVTIGNRKSPWCYKSNSSTAW